MESYLDDSLFREAAASIDKTLDDIAAPYAKLAVRKSSEIANSLKKALVCIEKSIGLASNQKVCYVNDKWIITECTPLFETNKNLQIDKSVQSAINSILTFGQTNSMKTVLKSQMQKMMETEQKRRKPDKKMTLNTTVSAGLVRRLANRTHESSMDPLQTLRHTTGIDTILRVTTMKLAGIVQLLRIHKRSRLFQAHQKNDSVRLVMAGEEVKPFKIFPVDRKSIPVSPMGFYSERGSSSVFQSSTEGLNTTEVGCVVRK